jgi:Undecaprenyl-phosphate galactose phosphotransferase WbaP
MPETGLNNDFGGPVWLQPGCNELFSNCPGRFNSMVCAVSLFTAETLAIIFAAVGASLVLWLFPAFEVQPNFAVTGGSQFWETAPELSAIGGIALIYMGLHGRYTRRLPFWTEVRETLKISLFAILATGFVEFAVHGDKSRHLLIGAWILLAPVSVLARHIARRLLALAGLWQIKVLVIGDSRETDDSSLLFRSERHLGYQVVGFMTNGQIQAARPERFFRSLLAAHGASRLVLTMNICSGAGIQIAKDVVRENVPFCLISHLPGIPVFGFEQVAFFNHDAIMLSYRNNVARPLARATKSAFDVIISFLLLILLSGPMAIVAVLIKADGGPVFFAHERVGIGGRRFRCLKFRTMFTNAEEMLQEVLASDSNARAQWAQTRKLAPDPRITPIGRFLRATSMDELPQLFNVLRLEMSLVGPRPIVQQEISRYEQDIAYYYGTKPGLTGLWQVSGRSDTTYRRRIELDSWYVRNWSMWHDIAIILKTVPVVFGRIGAR